MAASPSLWRGWRSPSVPTRARDSESPDAVVRVGKTHIARGIHGAPSKNRYLRQPVNPVEPDPGQVEGERAFWEGLVEGDVEHFRNVERPSFQT